MKSICILLCVVLFAAGNAKAQSGTKKHLSKEQVVQMMQGEWEWKDADANTAQVIFIVKGDTTFGTHKVAKMNDWRGNGHFFRTLSFRDLPLPSITDTGLGYNFIDSDFTIERTNGKLFGTNILILDSIGENIMSFGDIEHRNAYVYQRTTAPYQPWNGHISQTVFERDVVDSIFSEDADKHDLHDGGGCLFAENDDALKRGTHVLIEQSDKQVNRALVSVNHLTQLLNRDSNTVIHHGEKDESVIYYSNKRYQLTVNVFSKFVNGQAVEGPTGTMTIKNKKSGGTAKRNIVGSCGAN